MFTKDSRTEQFLTQMGVEFHYTNKLRFIDLEPGWRENNIGRPVSVRDDAVLEYARLMESHSAAPAPIVWKNDSYIVLDGVQRLAAAELVKTTNLSAYVVQSDSQDIIMAIRVLANARLQGYAEPPQWTRRRAIEILVVDRGLSYEEVARLGAWKVSDVREIAHLIKTGRNVIYHGGPELTDAMLKVLPEKIEQELKYAAKPVLHFLSLLKSSKLSAADAKEYVEAFFNPVLKSQDKMDVYSERAKQFRENPEIEARISGRKVSHLSKDVVARRSLIAAKTTLEEILETGEEIVNIDEFFKLTKNINKLLQVIGKKPKPRAVNRPGEMWSIKS